MQLTKAPVALHTEGVDRNNCSAGVAVTNEVALHTEGVDRNKRRSYSAESPSVSPSTRRAWIEMTFLLTRNAYSSRSPSTRRAWIEILAYQWGVWCTAWSPSTRRAWIEIVRPDSPQPLSRSPSTRRAWIEILLLRYSVLAGWSPSTRRAWIEIFFDLAQLIGELVALHTEGVDRNAYTFRLLSLSGVALHTEGVDRNLMKHGADMVKDSRPPHGGRG